MHSRGANPGVRRAGEATVPDRLEALEAQVATLTAQVAALQRQVDELEPAATAASVPTPPARRRRPAASAAVGATAAEGPLADAGAVLAIVPLAGRMFLLLAGAFVLRALTDSGVLPAGPGVVLGLAYAAGVLALAARTARPAAATFHALTAVLIGFPLLHEATARFQLLGPWPAALLLAALAAAVLGVAARRRLPWVAWVAAAAAVAGALGQVVGTGRAVAPALALVAVGLLAAWIGERGGWPGLRWPVALAADLLVFVAAVRAAAPSAVEGPVLTQVAAAALLGATLLAVGTRTVVVGRAAGAFEQVQTAGALAAGLGGLAWVAARSGGDASALGVLCLAVAAGWYAAAFRVLARRPGGTNVAFAAAVGLALAVTGAWLALPVPALGAALAILALAAASLGRAPARRVLRLHAAAFAAVAAGAGGLLLHADHTLFGPAAVPWPPLPPAGLPVLAGLLGAALLSAGAADRTGRLERGAQLVLDGVVALGAAGALAGWILPLLGAPGPEADLALAATGRTAVLAGGAVLAAWLGRREAGREAGWLAWPLLGVLGLKLLLEDLPRGRPTTLVLALALTGAALILVPRLRPRAAGVASVAAERMAG